ncbi:adenylate kinase [bacterium CPR1]|nr:adenylate kinase [bacterium CPR1]
MNTILNVRPMSAGSSPWGAVCPRKEEGEPLLPEDQFLAAARSSSRSGAPVQLFPQQGLAEAATVGAMAPGPTTVPVQILIMGPPGSGKGTQGAMLAERYGVPHISTGELLRAEVASGSERGQHIDSIIKDGNMVGSDLMYEMLLERMSQDDCKRGFILDGFPRQFEQVPMFRALRRELGFDEFIVVGLEVPDSETHARLAKRGRADDTPDVISHRLEVYHSETRPVIEYFRSEGEYFGVDGVGTVEEVNQRLQQVIDTPQDLRPR